jgi:hypothetical protein
MQNGLMDYSLLIGIEKLGEKEISTNGFSAVFRSSEESYNT